MSPLHPPPDVDGRQPQPRFLESIVNYLHGWRFDTSGVLGCFAAMYLGWILLADPNMLSLRLGDAAHALCSASCLVIAIFLINDAADRDIDRIVHPDRPIPRGVADWRHVYAAGLGLLAISAGLAAPLGTAFLATVATTIMLVLLYYMRLKRHPPLPCASELIAPLISALFPLSAFALASAPRADLLIAVAGFIYVADFAQDLLGGIHDEAGDRRFNVRTFAVTFGATVTARLSAAAFALSLVAAIVLWWRADLGWIFAATVVTLGLVMLRAYHAVLTAHDAPTLRSRAGHANHLGGVYYFVVSASLLPDEMMRRWLA
jgi:4-hydroxybenzoate polyprenyltransferase